LGEDGRKLYSKDDFVLRVLNETKSPMGKKEPHNKEFIGDGAEN
jgi:hypothetical protein